MQLSLSKLVVNKHNSTYLFDLKFAWLLIKFHIFFCEWFMMLKAWVWQYSHNAYLHSTEPLAILCDKQNVVHALKVQTSISHQGQNNFNFSLLSLAELIFWGITSPTCTSPIYSSVLPWLQLWQHRFCIGSYFNVRKWHLPRRKSAKRMWQKIPGEFKLVHL